MLLPEGRLFNVVEVVTRSPTCRDCIENLGYAVSTTKGRISSFGKALSHMATKVSGNQHQSESGKARQPNGSNSEAPVTMVTAPVRVFRTY